MKKAINFILDTYSKNVFTLEYDSNGKLDLMCQQHGHLDKDDPEFTDIISFESIEEMKEVANIMLNASKIIA